MLAINVSIDKNNKQTFKVINNSPCNKLKVTAIIRTGTAICITYIKLGILDIVLDSL